MIVFPSVAVFLFSAIALMVASGFSLGDTLLALGGMALLFRRPAGWRLAPLALFARRLRDGDGAVRGYALAGTLLTAAYLTFGLTQAFLTHNNGVMIFGFMTVILWASLRTRERLAVA